MIPLQRQLLRNSRSLLYRQAEGGSEAETASSAKKRSKISQESSGMRKKYAQRISARGCGAGVRRPKKCLRLTEASRGGRAGGAGPGGRRGEPGAERRD